MTEVVIVAQCRISNKIYYGLFQNQSYVCGGLDSKPPSSGFRLYCVRVDMGVGRDLFCPGFVGDNSGQHSPRVGPCYRCIGRYLG